LIRRILLTRPQADSEAFAAQLPHGWQAHIAPMQEMVDLPADPDFSGADALVFTSANAVRSFARRWAGHKLPAYCVGDATAAAARKIGLAAISAGGDSADLAAELASLPPQNLVYLHGQHLRAALKPEGQNVKSYVIYDQRAVPLDDATQAALAAGEITATALFSPRSARLFADARHNWPALECYCLSLAVAAAAASLGTCVTAARPTAEALLAMLSNDNAQ